MDSSLHIIYGYAILDRKSLREHAERIYSVLTSEMNLSRLDVNLIAYLENGNGPNDSKGCSRALNITRKEMAEMLDCLSVRGVICKYYFDSNGDHEVYYVSESLKEEVRWYDAWSHCSEEQLQTYVKNISEGLQRDSDYVKETDCRRIEKVIRLNPGFQFSKGYKELKAEELPHVEKCALFLMAGHFIRHGTMPLDGEKLGSKTSAEERRERLKSVLDKLSPSEETLPESDSTDLRDGLKNLVRRGLVSIVPDDGYNENRSKSNKQLYLLSEKSCEKLFKGMDRLIDYASIARNAEIIRCEDIAEKELYFDEGGDGQLERLKAVIASDNYAQFVDQLHRQGMAGAVTGLFYGAPGTGKTEFVRQLARESGRDIFVADVAKLYGSYWGETEKSMREIFRTFRYLNILSSKAPILLFNEADGILGKRMPATRSNEKSENAIQTIILQELEAFEGIFIATTNMAVNLDEAFERRFLIKVEFCIPSPQTAARIWQARIPDLTPQEALQLASRFSFSGGKIDNVCKKRFLDQVIYKTPVSFEDMLELCRNEEYRSEGTQAYYKYYQIVRSGDINSRELFFDEDVLQTVDTIRRMIVSDHFEEIVEQLKIAGLSDSANILLHGMPGTGKTELAMQLARESGRDIYIVDVAKLYSSFSGESEQNVREMFRRFRHLSLTADRSPILLFNEADGIIGKRLKTEHSLDKMENAVQSILLQELENFSGIFIATTNLINNIDEAFDRRFLYKVEFRNPSPQTAARIWRARIPEMSEAEAISLAASFSLSGGQIDNVVKRLILYRAVYGQKPSAEEMRQYCGEELVKARTGGNLAPTKGFSQYMELAV